MVRTATTLKELQVIAKDFLGALAEKPQTGRAVLVGLSGDLGAGKTAFTKCVASILGIADTITSPTFVLEKRYPIPRSSIIGKRFTKLIHVDAYRLHEGKEMRALDWETTLGEEGTLVLLEWPEQVADALTPDMITINFEYIDEGVRQISGNEIK